MEGRGRGWVSSIHCGRAVLTLPRLLSEQTEHPFLVLHCSSYLIAHPQTGLGHLCHQHCSSDSPNRHSRVKPSVRYTRPDTQSHLGPRGGMTDSPSDCISQLMSLSWIALSDKCVSPEEEGDGCLPDTQA